MPRRRVIAAGAALTLLGVLPSSGSAFGGEGWRTGTFRSVSARPTETIGLTSTGMPRADLCTPAAGRCSINFFGADTFSGSLDGTQVNGGTLALDVATFTGDSVSIATFSGSVVGCRGVGTALLRYTVKVGARPGQNVGTFEVIEGSGTSGLRGLEGDGTVVATPDGSNGFTSEGTVRMRCRR